MSKTTLFKIMGTVLFMTLLFCGTTIAQTTDWQAPTIDQWFGQMDKFYMAMTVVFGYLSGFIPGLNKVKAFWRVFAWGILTALGLLYFKDVSILKTAVEWFLSNLFYLVVLKEGAGLKSPSTAKASIE